MSEPMEIHFVGIALPAAKAPNKTLYAPAPIAPKQYSRLSNTWAAVVPSAQSLRHSSARQPLPRSHSTAFRSQKPTQIGRTVFPLNTTEENSRKEFLLAGRKTGMDRGATVATLSKAASQDLTVNVPGSRDSSCVSKSSSLDYSFLEAAKKRAIEQDSCSSSSSNSGVIPAPQYHTERDSGTVLLFSGAEKRKFVRFADRGESDWHYERITGVHVTYRLSTSCAWLQSTFDRCGLASSRSRNPAVRITAKHQPRFVRSHTVYNHLPGAAAMFPPDRFLATVQSGQWAENVPMTFNTAQETYSFARFRAAHPKSLWVRKDLQGKARTKVVSANSRAAEKSGFLFVRYIANPHLFDSKKYSLSCYILITSFSPITLYTYRSMGQVYRSTSNYTLSADGLSDPSVHFPTRSGAKVMNLVPLAALERYFAVGKLQFAEVQKQVKDLAVKAVLAHEKTAITAQTKHTAGVLRNCFEIVQFRYLVDDHLRVWLLSAKPAHWSTRHRSERSLLAQLLFDALNIVGVTVEKSSVKPANDEDFIKRFEDETNRHYQNQPNAWERLFPLANSANVYRTQISAASDKTKLMCKWLQTRR